MKSKIFNHASYQNILLSLLIISGGFKVFLEFYGYPFDLTLQILILILLDILYCALTNRFHKFTRVELFYLLMIIVFYFYSFISSLYSPSDYSYIKFFEFGVPLLSFLYVKFIYKLDLTILFKILLYIILPISLWFIIYKYLLYNDTFFFKIDRKKFTLIRSNYLNFGYLMGILSLLTLYMSKKALPLLIIIYIVIIGLGSRGALIFSFLVILIFNFKNILYLSKIRVTYKFLRFLLFVVFLSAIFFIVYFENIKPYISFGLNRFNSILDITTDNSASERIEQYTYVLKNSLNTKGLTIGHGLGSFGIDYTGVDQIIYPHNVFLEVLYEMGFFGLVIFTILLITPFSLNRNVIFKALAFFALLNALKTQSFAYDRNLYIFLGVLIFCRTMRYDIMLNGRLK